MHNYVLIYICNLLQTKRLIYYDLKTVRMLVHFVLFSDIGRTLNNIIITCVFYLNTARFCFQILNKCICTIYYLAGRIMQKKTLSPKPHKNNWAF